MIIESDSNPKVFYEVTEKSCTCPSFLIRLRGKGKCKHMIKFDKIKNDKCNEINLGMFEEGLDASTCIISDKDIQSLINAGKIYYNRKDDKYKIYK